MTEKELFNGYKATAPAFDLRFTIDHGFNMSPATMSAACALLAAFVTDDDRLRGISRPEFYRRLRNIQDEWRRESNRRERQDNAIDRLQEAARVAADLTEVAS